jgi:hypothetical protein
VFPTTVKAEVGGSLEKVKVNLDHIEIQSQKKKKKKNLQTLKQLCGDQNRVAQWPDRLHAMPTFVL